MMQDKYKHIAEDATVTVDITAAENGSNTSRLRLRHKEHERTSLQRFEFRH